MEEWLDDFFDPVLEVARDASMHREQFRASVLKRLDRLAAEWSSASRDQLMDRLAELELEFEPAVETLSEAAPAADLMAETVAQWRAGETGEALSAVLERAPAPLAYELERLLDDLSPSGPNGAQRQMPSAEAALLQVRDVVLVLAKVSAAMLARVGLAAGGAEQERAVREALVGRYNLSDGVWLTQVVPELASIVADLEAAADLHPLATWWQQGGLLRRFVSGFSEIRNREIGHAARRGDAEETARILRHIVLDGQAASEREGLAPMPSLAQALTEAPWRQTTFTPRLVARTERGGVVGLDGAQALRRWLDGACGPDEHQGREAAVLLLRAADAAELDLGPFLRARVCDRCQRRDVFLFDTLYQHHKFRVDLIDYARGHKMRVPGERVPDLQEWVQGAIEAGVEGRPATVDEAQRALSNRAVVEQLDEARIDRRYLSPAYLRSGLKRFLKEQAAGIYWLQAPAHIGKTMFIQGLTEPLLGEAPLLPADHDRAVAVVSFLFKREYRDGAGALIDALNIEMPQALGLRADVVDVPTPRIAKEAENPQTGFLDWIEAWRSFAQQERGLPTPPRLLIILDGLDEAVGPHAEKSPLCWLPAASALPEGVYLLLTSRRVGDSDAPQWLAQLPAQFQPDEPAQSESTAPSGSYEVRRVDLEDRDYRQLLREYIGKRLGETADPAPILEQAEGLFLYVAFLVEQRRLGKSLPDAQVTGPLLYAAFLDNLEADYGPKYAELCREVLAVLAAEELAHEWLWGEGAVIDPATDAVVTGVPRAWSGTSLERLARAVFLDQPVGGGKVDYDGLFVSVLLTLQGVLGLSRPDVGVPYYRLGLKGMAQVVAEHLTTRALVVQSHAGLAALTLDDIEVWDTTENEAKKAALAEAASDGLLRLRGHLQRAASEPLWQRHDIHAVVALCESLYERADRTANPTVAVAWGDGLLAQILFFLEHLDEANRLSSLARAYTSRGNSKMASTSHGAEASLDDYNAAIGVLKDLRVHLGEARWWDSPALVNDLLRTLNKRGVAKRKIASNGTDAALEDYDAAIELGRTLQAHLGNGQWWDWPKLVNELAAVFCNRGVAKRSSAMHGATASVEDYDVAISLREELRSRLGESTWRASQDLVTSLAAAYSNRGYAKQLSMSYGAGAAVADYDEALSLRKDLRALLGEAKWWESPKLVNRLATTYNNLGYAKQLCPAYDASEAVSELNVALELRETLCEKMGEPRWWASLNLVEGLVLAYHRRGNAKLKNPAQGASEAIYDFNEGIDILKKLREHLGEELWWARAGLVNGLAAIYSKSGEAKNSSPISDAAAAMIDYDAAIHLAEKLRMQLGERRWWESPDFVNVLVSTYLKRGWTIYSAMKYGLPSALHDLNKAISLQTYLRRQLGEPLWRESPKLINTLARGYFFRGSAQLDAMHDESQKRAAHADLKQAHEMLKEPLSLLGENCPKDIRRLYEQVVQKLCARSPH